MPASTPSVQHSLLGIDVWDGMQHIGSHDVSWRLEGPDASFSDVAPSASSAHSGLTLVPGLIDTHVHLVGDASGGPSDFLTWPLTTRPEEQVLHGLAHARRALTGGVTTLRDLSCDDIQFSLARGLASGVVEGPRVLAYGLVTMTGGHGDLFVPPAVPEQLRKRTADGPDACRQLVRHWARSGADGIKITTSGGVLSDGDKNSWRNYTAAELDAIVDEAHALGLRVAAHAHTPEGVEAALDAGVDSIEHATNITEELAERVVTAGLPVAPTLLINDSLADGSAPASAAQQEKVRELVRIRDARLRYAADAGVNFVLGTDANGFHIDFGDQFAELRRMVEILGYSPERALQAGTSAAAEVIGAGDSLGRIREGAHADFLIMRGAPWQNAEDLSVENIVAVVSKGRVVVGELPTA